jgi:hypothetical protein
LGGFSQVPLFAKKAHLFVLRLGHAKAPSLPLA